MRAIRLMVNWVVILLLPVWIIPVAIVSVFETIEHNAVTGNKWFWE